jgi:hypothetical protein
MQRKMTEKWGKQPLPVAVEAALVVRAFSSQVESPDGSENLENKTKFLSTERSNLDRSVL